MSVDAETLLDDLALPPKARRDVPRVLNRLLGQTFLYQDAEADKDDYYFVHRHQPAVEALLNLSGFKLLHDEYHRIFQVVSEFSYCRARYRLDQTLMILVLRKLYEERVERLSLANDPVVIIGEVREEYRTITGKERGLGIGQYESLLRRMRRLGLIELLDGRTFDVRNGEVRLRLRGSVRMILPIQTVDWTPGCASIGWSRPTVRMGTMISVLMRVTDEDVAAKDDAMINELDSVVLTMDIPDLGLKRGDLGTVGLVHREGEGYEVEFTQYTVQCMALCRPSPGCPVTTVASRRDAANALPTQPSHECTGS